MQLSWVVASVKVAVALEVGEEMRLGAERAMREGASAVATPVGVS